mmetsp:Transcript_16079/g.30371  ORF Transcript_16079/g.30371 Transcript_16079/m.30371 type:complete len:336 (-) Transcript_16079:2326-3333(-)
MGCTSSRDTTIAMHGEDDLFERHIRRYQSRRRAPIRHIPPTRPSAPRRNGRSFHHQHPRIVQLRRNLHDPVQISSHYYRNHLADLEAFSRRFQQHSHQGNGNDLEVDLEIRQLQSDLDTLERLFQALLGHGFAEHFTNSLDTDQDVYLNSSSCPPASNDVIQNLPCVEISEEDLREECNRECCICFYEHKVGDVQVARLPCGHLFHQKCISDWLTKKCTCPICRYELPSDNEMFEQGRVERMKSRKLRVRSHELERMSVQQLQDMVDAAEVEDRSELMKMLHDSDRVEILDTSLPVSSTALTVEPTESGLVGTTMNGLNPDSGEYQCDGGGGDLV